MRLSLLRKRLLPVLFLTAFTTAVSWSAKPARLTAAGQDDPAGDLYEKAQYTMSDEDYRKASEEFRKVFHDYPASEYAGDALYWEAFCRYRIGGTSELRTALESLEVQRERYKEAATRRDAAELATRIRGELARRGDAVAAAEVARQASELARSRAELEAQAREMAKEAVELSREEAEMEKVRRQIDHIPAPAAMPNVALPAVPLSPMLGISEEDETRLAALNALFQIDPDRAFPIVEKILKRRDTESVKLREQALLLLGGITLKKNEDLLLDVVRNDPDPGVQEEAVFWLSRTPSDESFALFEDLLQKPYDPGVQEAVVMALANDPDERANKLLKNLASSDSSRKHIRQAAIMGLGGRTSPGTYEFLRSLYDRLTDDELKENTMHAIVQSDGENAKNWLRGIVLSGGDKTESPVLRTVALYLAGENGYITASELAGLYDRLTDHEMREQIIYVLGQSDDPKAMDKIMDIARNEKDSDLRRTAIFWIGYSGDAGDESAVKFLEELINE